MQKAETLRYAMRDTDITYKWFKILPLTWNIKIIFSFIAKICNIL